MESSREVCVCLIEFESFSDKLDDQSNPHSTGRCYEISGEMVDIKSDRNGLLINRVGEWMEYREEIGRKVCMSRGRGIEWRRIKNVLKNVL
jgi:hypothetical protein